MTDQHLTSEKNGLRMGLYTALVLVAYTGVAALTGFLGQIEAGALDIVLLAGGVVLAIRRLKRACGDRMKSMLWTIAYRSPERTLTVAEVDAAHEGIVARLVSELPAQRR